METATQKPTIKGVFVKSHINIVRRQRGDEGVRALERKFGRPLDFKNSDDVPVRDEVKLIESALDVLSPSPVSESEYSYEAGRLHFNNFTLTPLGRIAFSLFAKEPSTMMRSRNIAIAEHVFQGLKVSAEGLAGKMIKVVMENNDYPLDHFRGFFQAWMEYAGFRGFVFARETRPNRYEYTIHWD